MSVDGIITTQRLVLSPFTAGCIGPEYLGWLNDPLVMRFSNQRFHLHTPGSAHNYLASFEGTANRFFAIHQLQDKRMIGTMTAYIAAPHRTVDLGLLIGDRSVWGRGYGLEAWSALMSRLFGEGLRKVTGGTVRPNTGMQKIMQRSGMRMEAVRERHEIVGEEEVDVLYYARFRDA
ncbi:MAG: GNAT family N-acetyltransferase [Steroidobacteraceae bacterium]